MKLIETILEEWAHRVPDGSPTQKNPYHLVILEDVLHEKKLPKEAISYILNKLREADAEVMGKTVAQAREKAKRGQTYSSEKAKKVYKKGEEDSDKSEKETKKSEKDKSLREDAKPLEDFNNKDEFTKTGISDEEFENNPNVEKNSEKDFKLDDKQVEKLFGNPLKFPKRYIKTLERLMSMQRTKTASITDAVKGVGAGELGAQAGEILTMMGATIKDSDSSEEFFNMLREHTKGANKPIITKSWIDSAENVRKGMFKRYDSQYGEGEWEITSAGWDVQNEVESMGMKDYKKNKGFSTDAYFVINGKDMDEVSLKKDLNANLLNATTGRVLDLIIQGNAQGEELENYNKIMAKATSTGKFKPSVLSDEEKQQLSDVQDKYKSDEYGWDDNVDVQQAKKRQQNLQNELMKSKSLKDDVKGDRDLTDEEKLKIGQSMAISKKDRDSVIDIINNDIPRILELLQEPSDRNDLKRVMKELGMKTDSRKLGKMTVIMGRIANVKNSDSVTSKNLNSMIENAQGHSKSVSEAIIKSPELRKGLMRSIRDALPLKSLFEGEEKMHLGDQTLDQEILTTMFGVSNFEELSQSLTLVGDAIVYQAKVVNPETGKEETEDIPIATMTNRPDGIAYGETWKLEFKVHPEFKKRVKKTNQELGRI